MPECLQVLYKYKQKSLRLTTQTHIHTGHRQVRRRKLAFKLLFSSLPPSPICQIRQRRISDLLWFYWLYQHLNNTSGTSSATVQCEPDSPDLLRITALNWKVPKATTWEFWKGRKACRLEGSHTLGRGPTGVSFLHFCLQRKFFFLLFCLRL